MATTYGSFVEMLRLETEAANIRKQREHAKQIACRINKISEDLMLCAKDGQKSCLVCLTDRHENYREIIETMQQMPEFAGLRYEVKTRQEMYNPENSPFAILGDPQMPGGILISWD